MKKLSVRELVLNNRSYRRFDAGQRVPSTVLRNLVGLARLAPTGGNLQSLRFKMINRPAQCQVVYPCLAWAGYLTEWAGPAPDERPTAYIVILNDTTIRESAATDVGIAAQTMMLGAVEAGFGGCMIGSVSRGALHKKLGLPKTLHIELVLALGKPVEPVKIGRVRNDDIKYWRDQRGVHHVPKRSVQDLVVQ